MISERILAYRYKGEWIKASEVQKARESDRAAFPDAHPYTRSALRNRAVMGRDVPEWVRLDTLDNQ